MKTNIQQKIYAEKTLSFPYSNSGRKQGELLLVSYLYLPFAGRFSYLRRSFSVFASPPLQLLRGLISRGRFSVDL
jgi:hypothetical protein